MRRTFRYRLYPAKAQAEAFDRQLGLCRELYNATIQEWRDAWRINHVSIGFNAQSAQPGGAVMRTAHVLLMARPNNFIRETGEMRGDKQ